MSDDKKLPVQKQKIITLVPGIYSRRPKHWTEEKAEPIKVDLTDKFTSRAIVKQEAMMETCPLFDQLLMVLEDNGEDNAAADKKSQGMALYDQLLIMDFDDIFSRILIRQMNRQKRRNKIGVRIPNI